MTMHKLTIAALAGAILAASGTSAALAGGPQDGPYIRVDGGVSFEGMEDFGSGFDFRNDDWNEDITTPVFGLGVGYKIGRFRADLAFDYRRKKNLGKFLHPTRDFFRSADADITSYGIMANGYWDIHTVSLGRGFGDTEMTLTPYVGAGIGGAILSVETSSADKYRSYANNYEKHNLAWAAMAGAAVQVTETTAIDVGYRYQDLGPFMSSDLGFDDLTTHDLRIGLRYSFF